MKRRVKILSINMIKIFQKTRTSICNIIDDDVDNVIMSKIFDKMTTFDDNFDEITTTKRYYFENILTIFDSKNIFNRFNNVIIYLTTFSYFRTKSTTLSSFDNFFQTLYSNLYFFYRIKYFDSFFFWRLLINRSISKNLTLTILFSTNIKFDWLNLNLRKKSSKKTKHNFNYVWQIYIKCYST